MQQLLTALALAATLEAGQIQTRPPDSSSSDDGPPAPVAPAVINRDSAGRATIRAVRIATPLRIDGRLDEMIYEETAALDGFIQTDPQEGAAATEKTEAWVFFDERHVYIVARCWESRPDQIIANEMRRDNTTILQNDQFAWGLDTFYDRRNMLIFEVSAAGGRIDGQVTNERQMNIDWNPIWDVKVARFEGGYVVEAAIPFRSLRYQPGVDQVWGIQMRRRNMAKNEWSYLTPIPASVGNQGHFRASLAARLVGLETPERRLEFEAKPFATAGVTSDRVARNVVDDGQADGGVDAKYGLTESLIADVTINTDFAQVEADEQQVNLTRFNLFFPEKRDFFLENAGLFAFGATASLGSAAGDVPLIFYSRNIGLFDRQEVPIRAGGRLSGRAGPYSVGALNVQVGSNDAIGAGATNFSVLRVRRDVGRRQSVGAIFTNRSLSLQGSGSNQVYGADTAISIGTNLSMTGYFARSDSPGEEIESGPDSSGPGASHSYRGALDYNGDRYGLQLDHLVVGRRFDPQVGFARRRDMRRNLGSFRFSPRPRNSEVVRKYQWSGSFAHIADLSGRLESRTVDGQFELQFQTSDRFFVSYTDSYEFLEAPFPIATNVTLQAGSYDFRSGRVGYNFGRQRTVSGNVVFDHGTFYDGHKTTIAISAGRANFGPQLSVEPALSINKVDVSQGAFTTRILTSRVTYTMTPLMFASALIQYNSDTSTVAANVRFRWEYRPGSEVFVVFNQTGDTLTSGFPDLVNRSVILKVTRLVRF